MLYSVPPLLFSLPRCFSQAKVISLSFVGDKLDANPVAANSYKPIKIRETYMILSA